MITVYQKLGLHSESLLILVEVFRLVLHLKSLMFAAGIVMPMSVHVHPMEALHKIKFKGI